MRKTLLTAVLTAILLPVAVFAGAPRIISVTMDKANPSYGDLVLISVTACVDKYASAYIDIAVSDSALRKTVSSIGQVFVVSSAGINVHKMDPNPFGLDIGYLFASADAGAANDCVDCGGSTDSRTITRYYAVNIPDYTYFGDCDTPPQLYLHVGMKDSYFAKSDWVGLPACQYYVSSGWAQIIPPQGFQIHKSAEGVVVNPGDKLLYKVDYEYQNGSGFRIVDEIPNYFTLVSYGPVSITGGSVTVSSSSITYNFASMAGQLGSRSGTTWMLLQWNGGATGGYTSTATGSWAGSNPQTSSVSNAYNAAQVKLSKTQSKDQLMQGNNITYYLSYEANGYSLVAFETFDNASGVYSGGSAPPGWKSVAESGMHGTWTVKDPCLTGSKYITGSSTQYPGLLLEDGDDLNNSDQFCEGMIVADFKTEPSTIFPGADSQIIIRSNGIQGTSGRSYGLVISADNAPSPGYLMLQKCGGGCSYPAGALPQIGQPVIGKWYRVRINVTTITGGQRIQAKIWERGGPEPVAWDIDYQDTSLSATDWRCDGGGAYTDWRPGVNINSGDYDDVQNSYDNFTVYAPRVATGALYVQDDIPAGIMYMG
ncbi:MAG TPA: hypothetical protein P5511_00340, partial [Candidatus Goldiibacteriota bacterium]|nr:hypothetical protein [Candidatus Goldiibacteriota bacterium]